MGTAKQGCVIIKNMKKKTEQNSTKSELIRAILSSEAKFVIGIVGFVMGVVAPYYQMKQDVALIQKDISTINSNHLMHTQDLAQEVKDVTKIIEEQQRQIAVLQTQQAIILEKLK